MSWVQFPHPALKFCCCRHRLDSARLPAKAHRCDACNVDSVEGDERNPIALGHGGGASKAPTYAKCLVDDVGSAFGQWKYGNCDDRREIESQQVTCQPGTVSLVPKDEEMNRLAHDGFGHVRRPDVQVFTTRHTAQAEMEPSVSRLPASLGAQ